MKKKKEDNPKNINEVKSVNINLISLDNKPINKEATKDPIRVSNKFIK